MPRVSVGRLGSYTRNFTSGHGAPLGGRLQQEFVVFAIIIPSMRQRLPVGQVVVGDERLLDPRSVSRVEAPLCRATR